MRTVVVTIAQMDVQYVQFWIYHQFKPLAARATINACNPTEPTITPFRCSNANAEIDGNGADAQTTALRRCRSGIDDQHLGSDNFPLLGNPYR